MAPPRLPSPLILLPYCSLSAKCFLNFFLKSLIRRKIADHDTLWLIDKIVDNGNHVAIPIQYFPGDDLLTPLERSRRLPIGNLTSQFFANIYLNGLDHFVQDRLKIPKYLRYVDDCALFDDDQSRLTAARGLIEAYLSSLRLLIHPIKSQIYETRGGANFVGFRVLPDRIQIRNDSLRRGRKRHRLNRSMVSAQQMTSAELARSRQSWFAHLKHGDTWRLRQSIMLAEIGTS